MIDLLEATGLRDYTYHQVNHSRYKDVMNRISPPKASSAYVDHKADVPLPRSKKWQALGIAVSLLRKISPRIPRKFSQLKVKLSYRRKKITHNSAELSPEAQEDEGGHPKARFMTPLAPPTSSDNAGSPREWHSKPDARDRSDQSHSRPITTKTVSAGNPGKSGSIEARTNNTRESHASSLLHPSKLSHASAESVKQQHKSTRHHQRAMLKKQVHSCPGLKKSDAPVVALFESITVDDLLAMRKKYNDLSPVSIKEIERLTAKKLARQAAMMTFKRGAMGSSLCGAALGFLSTFFPPFGSVALAGTCTGFIATGIVCFIKYYHVKARARRTLSMISGSTNPKTAEISEVLQKKTALLDRQIQHLREKQLSRSVKGKKISEKVDGAFSGLGVLSTAFWRFSVLAPVLKTVAVGFDIVFAAVSTAFMATTNYITRQKKLKTLGDMLAQSVVPDFMQRRLFFPLGYIIPGFIQNRLSFAKKSPYELYVQSNAEQIAAALGMEANSPVKAIIEQLASPQWRTLTESIKWQCKRRVLLKEFSTFCAIPHNRLLACSDNAFELLYGAQFDRFVVKKIGRAAFKDTCHAGIKGTMAITLPTAVTCLFFGVLAPAIPFLLLGAGVGMGICYAVAKREEKKFRVSAFEALNSARVDEGSLRQQREMLKQILLRKKEPDLKTPSA